MKKKSKKKISVAKKVMPTATVSKKKVVAKTSKPVKKKSKPTKKTVTAKAPTAGTTVVKKIQDLSHQIEPMLELIKDNASKYGKIAGDEIVMLGDHLRELIHSWTAKPITKVAKKSAAKKKAKAKKKK